MPVLIDGHNLIGWLPDVHLEDEHDEAQLVFRLQAYTARTGKRVTVVFDRGLPGGVSRALSGGRVEVVFAPTGGSADDVLRHRIRRAPDPGGLIVVSSDREVIAAAEDRGARVVRAEAFVSQLESPPPRGIDEKADGRVAPEEVDEWLKVFGEDGF